MPSRPYFQRISGQIESGVVSVGDDIITLPSGESAKVKSILVGDKDSQSAQEGQPVTIQLDKEVDVSRGCVLSRNNTSSKQVTYSNNTLDGRCRTYSW